MAAANGAGASGDVTLSLHRIVVSPSGALAVLLSASRIILVSLQPGQQPDHGIVLASLSCPSAVPLLPYSSTTICFPRHAAFSPDEKRLAVIGDDKVLHVWDINTATATAADSFKPGAQVMVRPVPKRASLLLWEQDSQHVILGDRFGDVRVFDVDENTRAAVPKVLSILESNASKSLDERNSISAALGKPARDADSDDEDRDDGMNDDSLAPRLGHVSMLAAALLIGESPAPYDSRIPRYIVTADRDEHIRVSRWGPSRAGWIVENYLLGSDAFVAALALLPPSSVAQLFPGTPTSGAGLLLASDGGRRIRAWDYLQTDSASQLVAAVDVSAAILPHVVLQGKGSNAGRKRRKIRAETNLSAEQDEIEATAQRMAEENSKLAITQLQVVEVQGQSQILFTAEGSTAFFSMPTSLLATSSPSDVVDVSAQVQAVSAGAVILGVAFHQDTSGAVRAWVTLDTTEARGRESTSIHFIKVFEFGIEGWTESKDAGSSLEQSLQAAQGQDGAPVLAIVDSNQAKKISATFYDALKTYPKNPGEGTSALPMSSAGILEESTVIGQAASKRRENMERIRALMDGGVAEAKPTARRKVKKEPQEERVYEIMAVDEQVGGAGSRREGKSKEAEVEVGPEAEANDAEEVEVEVAQETEVQPEDGEDAGAGAVTMEDRMAKLRELRKKMSDSARANRKDVIAEQSRLKNGGQARDPHKKSWKLHKAEKILEERDLRESGEDVDRARAWTYSIEDNEAWERKLEEKEERKDKGPVDFNTAAERSYQRKVRSLKPDLNEYERTMADASAAAGASSSSSGGGSSQALIRTAGAGTLSDVRPAEHDALSYGTHKPSEAALERLASHINNEHEVRANRSRKRPVDPDAEVTYINEKNRRFNEKAERYFGKYTKEIKDSFERGTAL